MEVISNYVEVYGTVFDFSARIIQSVKNKLDKKPLARVQRNLLYIKGSSLRENKDIFLGCCLTAIYLKSNQKIF